MSLFATPDAALRLAVFGLELLLTFTLILWLRVMSRGEAAPWSFLGKLLFFGALTALLAGFVELHYSFNVDQLQAEGVRFAINHGPVLDFLNSLSSSLIEELAKYFIAVLLLIHTKHIHKLSDAILYLIVIGLGFSLIEDALFLASPLTIAPYRLLSFYLHSGTSAIIGYSFGRFKFGLTGYTELMYGIGGAVGLHLAYNLSTSLQDGPAAFYLAVLLVLYITLQIFILFRRAVIEEYVHEKSSQPKRRHRLLNI